MTAERSGSRSRALVGVALTGLFVTVTAIAWGTGAGGAAALLQGLVITLEAIFGMAIWRLARHGTLPIFELLGMGLAIGITVSTLCDVGLVLIAGLHFGWMLPALFLIPFALPSRRSLGTLSVSTAETAAFGVSALTGLAVTALGWWRSPLPVDSIPSSLHPDALFFEGLANGLASFGPRDSVFMAGTSLRYHWLSYAWAGDLTQATGTASFHVLARTLPLVALIASLSLAVSWARRQSSVPWVPLLAGLLITMSGFVAAKFGVLLNADSPSQQMSVVWSLALVIALLAYIDRSAHVPGLLVLAVLAVGATGGKVSAGVICTVGALCVAGVALVRKEPGSRRAALAGAVVAVGSLIGYLAFIFGVDVAGNIAVSAASEKASTFQGLDPTTGPLGPLLGTAILIFAVLPRLAGLAPLLASRTHRWKPAVVFAISTVTTGCLVLFLLSEGINDLWFVLAASAPACVVAAVGVGIAVPDAVPTRARVEARLLTIVLTGVALVSLVALQRTADPHTGVRVWGMPLFVWIAALAVSGLVSLVSRDRGLHMWMSLMVVSLTVFGLGARMFVFGGDYRPTDTSQVSDVNGTASGGDGAAQTNRPTEVWEAAQWVRQNVPIEAVIATNRPDSLEVPALSGLRTYLSGSRYETGLVDSASSLDVPVRRANSLALDGGPSAVAPLCSEGVSWLWLQGPGLEQDFGDLATEEYRNDSVALWRLDPSACG